MKWLKAVSCFLLFTMTLFLGVSCSKIEPIKHHIGGAYSYVYVPVVIKLNKEEMKKDFR